RSEELSVAYARLVLRFFSFSLSRFNRKNSLCAVKQRADSAPPTFDHPVRTVLKFYLEVRMNHNRKFLLTLMGAGMMLAGTARASFIFDFQSVTPLGGGQFSYLY